MLSLKEKKTNTISTSSNEVQNELHNKNSPNIKYIQTDTSVCTVDPECKEVINNDRKTSIETLPEKYYKTTPNNIDFSIIRS